MIENPSIQNLVKNLGGLRLKVWFIVRRLSFRLLLPNLKGRPKYIETKVEREGVLNFCLNAVSRFHHFHPSTSFLSAANGRST